MIQRKLKWTLIGIVICAILLLFYGEPIKRGIMILTEGSVTEMVSWIRSFGMIGPVVSVLLMIFQAIAAPLPSFLITGANGIVFGITGGIIISWLGAMAGALVSFYIAKWFGTSILGKKKKKVQEAVESFSSKHGFIVVLVARLVPVVSFDLISYAAGLSQMKLKSFLLATGIGMLPATVIYTIMGHDLINIEQYSERFVLFGILLAILLLIGYLVRNKIVKKDANE